ncbi:Pka-C3, partial [Symbiodinium microadriaticum]
YICPELILGEGVDHACDLWALGVMMHEMYMLRTPFVNEEDAGDMDTLFQNIVHVRLSGSLNLSEHIDSKDGSALAKDLMLKLITGEREARLGYREQSTRSILKHAFFNAVNVSAIENQLCVPPYVPPEFEGQ